MNAVHRALKSLKISLVFVEPILGCALLLKEAGAKDFIDHPSDLIIRLVVLRLECSVLTRDHLAEELFRISDLDTHSVGVLGWYLLQHDFPFGV